MPEQMQELVRYATLAANGHNTQPWKFALAGLSAASAVVNVDRNALQRAGGSVDGHHEGGGCYAYRGGQLQKSPAAQVRTRMRCVHEATPRQLLVFHVLEQADNQPQVYQRDGRKQAQLYGADRHADSRYVQSHQADGAA